MCLVTLSCSRFKLFESAQNMPSKVLIAVRIRPLIQHENEKGNSSFTLVTNFRLYFLLIFCVSGCTEVVLKSDEVPQVTVIGKDTYNFNQVFGPTDSQEKVYCDAVEPMIDNLFKGHNLTILVNILTFFFQMIEINFGNFCRLMVKLVPVSVSFACLGGSKNFLKVNFQLTGKTYTMGTAYKGDEGHETGVIPRAVRDIFKKIQEKQQDIDVSISCSYYELYDEKVFDLLTDAGTSREKMSRKVIVNKIQNLTEKPVMTPEDCLSCLQIGSLKTTVGATAMNKKSSRSHAIYTINLSIKDEASEIKSRFLLVDLGGSEKCKRSNATVAQMKEGVSINKGLSTLGNVIYALCSNAVHIPYRDSTLTRLLEDSLGKRSYIVMIACVSPANNNMEETNNTLIYANRFKKIKPSSDTIDKLRSEVQRYKQLYEDLKKEHEECRNKPVEAPNVLDDIQQLRLELEVTKKTCADLNDKYSTLMLTVPGDQHQPDRQRSPGPSKCLCKLNCDTRMCSCYKKSEPCSENCKCDQEICLNKENNGDLASSVSY